MSINRRNFLSLLGTLPCANVLAKTISAKSFNSGGRMVGGVLQYRMIAKYYEREIVAGTASKTIEYHIDGQSKTMPFPIIRTKAGEKIRIIVKNEMDKTTTVHWHGIRLINSMDGVPYLTQPPIKVGATFVYEFECLDSGTFWFHSHQNALEQMARGQVGVLIVDEPNTNIPAIKQFSADAVWVVKDYYIDNEAKLNACTTMKNAATTGTFGKQKRVNGKKHTITTAPAESWVRIRLLNCDNSRLMRIGAYDETDNKVDCYIVCIDGNPLQQYKLLNRYHLTPGQRLDIAVKVPTSGIVAIKNVFQKIPYILGIVKSNGDVSNFKPLQSLPLNPIPQPNLQTAKKLKFMFLAAAESAGKMWSINGKSMIEHPEPQDYELVGNPYACSDSKNDMAVVIKGAGMAEPLAVLKMGETYIFRIQNGTPHTHPIHLHGHTFTVLKSNKNRKIKPYHTDTVALAPKEKIEFAFVADNPGDWMFHCHIIEHATTGMMGYIRVK